MTDMKIIDSPYGIETPGGVIGYQEPPISVIPPFHKTDGPLARRFLEKTGIFLDAWQCGYFDHLMAKRENGLFAARTAGLVIARQNGKTELAAARIIVGLFLLKEPLIVYTAHTRQTAMAVFKRVRQIIDASPMLKKRAKVRLQTGDESVTSFDTKTKKIVSEVQFKVRTPDSGRGLTASCVLVDEAMKCDRKFVGDMMPTMSAVKNAQIIFMGSAGTQTSTAFGDVRRRAFSDNPRALLWYEWSLELCDDYCDKDCGIHIDPYSLEAYRLTNPAYGIRISHEAILDELDTMKGEIANFHRERLSVGDWPIDLEDFSIIPLKAWEKAVIPEPENTGMMVFAVAMSADRTSTVITGSKFVDEEERELVTWVLPDSERSGTSWAFERIIELNQKWKKNGLGGFVIDSRGQASTLIEDLRRKSVRVYSPSSLEYAQACAEFAVGVTGTKAPNGHDCMDEGLELYDADTCVDCHYRGGYVKHINDPMLTTAVAGAGKRKLSGLWAWAKGNEQSNIVPLEAATLGVWGLQRVLKDSKMALPIITRLGV